MSWGFAGNVVEWRVRVERIVTEWRAKACDRRDYRGVVGEWVCVGSYRGEGEGAYSWGMSWRGG